MDSMRLTTPQSARSSPGPRENQPTPALPAPTEFAFISNDNPDKIKDPNNRRKVRRHVMKDIGMSRRRTSPKNSRSRSSSARPSSPPIPTYISSLGEWNESETELQPQTPSIDKALDMVDEAIVRLCTSNLALNFLRKTPRHVGAMGVEQPGGGLNTYTKSLGFIGQHIGNGEHLSEHMSDALLSAIVCLAFYDMQTLRITQWTIHMNGMMKIVQGQGGFERLESQPILHQALFWSDLLGCLIIDNAPRTPLPKSLSLSPQTKNAQSGWRHSSHGIVSQRYPLASDLITPLRSLFQFVNAANTLGFASLANNDGWHDWTAQFAQAVNEVLSLPRLEEIQRYRRQDGGFEMQAMLREAVRVAAIQLLLLVARNPSQEDMYDARFYRGRIASLTQSIDHINWSGIESLRLWILVVGAMDELGEARMYLVEQIRHVSAEMGLQSWDEILREVAQVAWIGQRFSAMGAVLEQEVFIDPSL